MTTSLNDFRGYVLFCANEGIGAEIGDARFGVDCGEGCANVAIAGDNHGWSTTRTGLFGEIEVGKHDMAGLMEENV